jgi:hypothetical protein
MRGTADFAAVLVAWAAIGRAVRVTSAKAIAAAPTNVSLDAQLVADIKAIAAAVKGAVSVTAIPAK